MKLPIQTSYRHMHKSEAVDAFVRARPARLAKISPDIVRCAVVIEAPHQQHHQGNLFHVRVRVRLTLPSGDLVVARDPLHHAHQDVFAAVRDAYRGARRLDLLRVRRGQIKAHEEPSRGRVTRLLPGEGPGFRASSRPRDGREIYFHEKSVVDGYDRLARGTWVRFAEETGQAGPQASTVRIVRTRAPAQ